MKFYCENSTVKTLYLSSTLYVQTPPPEQDKSPMWKKCHSQFTDTDDYRRHGHNTWMDETGLYANTGMKRELIKPTDTIPERLS